MKTRRNPLDEMSMEELQALRVSVESDPANRAPADSLYLYTPKAQKRLRQIDRAIADNVARRRTEAGDPIPVAGYTGRQSNRR